MDDPDREMPADEPETLQPAATSPHAAVVALGAAVATWQRRGYQVRYRDEHLVQLVRRGWPDWEFIAFIVLGVMVTAAVVLAGISRRPWHVVSLTTTSEGHVITHRQWSARPPSDE